MPSRFLLAFSSLAHTYSHLLMLLYPTVVLALGPVHGLAYDELVALALPGFVLFGAGALPAGWLGDRWSSSAMMVIFFVGTGAGAMLTGLARTPLEGGGIGRWRAELLPEPRVLTAACRPGHRHAHLHVLADQDDLAPNSVADTVQTRV